VARGFLEARSMPLVGEADGDVPLMLPLASTESRLRRALLPGLLHRIESNFNRGARDLRLFEIGTGFAVGPAEMPAESTRLAAAFTGARHPDHWTGRPPMFDLWDVRGLLDEIAARLGARVEPGAATDAPFAAFDDETVFRAITADGACIGAGGRIARGAVDAPAWAEPVWGIELVLRPEMARRAAVSYQTLPSQPAMDRDIALLVGASVPAVALESSIRLAGGPWLERVEVFDVYTGKGTAPGTRSVAFRLRFRAPDRTLTVAELDTQMDRILKRLKDEHDAQRRG
jgi:phenylalanyl-tRNA synthetase beta chain